MLIRDGATLIRSARDVIEATASPEARQAVEPPPNAETTAPHDPLDAHEQILDLLGPTPIAEDQLIRDTGLPAQSVISSLLALEMHGQITRAPGGLLSRTPQG